MFVSTDVVGMINCSSWLGFCCCCASVVVFVNNKCAIVDSYDHFIAVKIVDIVICDEVKKFRFIFMYMGPRQSLY